MQLATNLCHNVLTAVEIRQCFNPIVFGKIIFAHFSKKTAHGKKWSHITISQRRFVDFSEVSYSGSVHCY